MNTVKKERNPRPSEIDLVLSSIGTGTMVNKFFGDEIKAIKKTIKAIWEKTEEKYTDEQLRKASIIIEKSKTLTNQDERDAELESAYKDFQALKKDEITAKELLNKIIIDTKLFFNLMTGPDSISRGIIDLFKQNPIKTQTYNRINNEILQPLAGFSKEHLGENYRERLPDVMFELNTETFSSKENPGNSSKKDR